MPKGVGVRVPPSPQTPSRRSVIMMAQESNLPPLPEKFPHIFVDIAWDMLPEMPYKDLVYLSQLVMQSGREKLYEPLVDCLRKIQWAKLAGLEAIIIERRIVEQAGPQVIPFDPVGQVQHMKALFDFVAHGKASLDSLAVFLNELLGLDRRGGNRDFRKANFFQAVCDSDNIIGQHIKALREWLDKDRDTSDSIIATRDQWLHRGRPAITAMFPPTEIGYLPIPKALKGGFPSLDTPLSSEYYWKTAEFVDFHFGKLTSLFVTIITRCISIEEGNTLKSIPPRDSLLLHPISALAMRGTRNTTLKQMKVRAWSPVFLDANRLMTDLPHQLLSLITEQEANIFAKLAKYRTFSIKDSKYSFVLANNNFLKASLGISSDAVRLLEHAGLITRRQLTITKGTTFICGFRGFRVLWSDDQSRDVPAVFLTKFGIALASLVKNHCDDVYVNNFISVMNSNRVSVELLAITDLKETGFRYDYLGKFEY